MRVLAAATAILATKYDIDLHGIEEFVGGFMYGVIQADDLKEIETCLTDGEALEVEVTNAISDIQKGDIPDIVKGIQEMGQVVKELPNDLKDCQGM